MLSEGPSDSSSLYDLATEQNDTGALRLRIAELEEQLGMTRLRVDQAIQAQVDAERRAKQAEDAAEEAKARELQAIVAASSANQAQANAEEKLKQVELETEHAAQARERAECSSSSFQLHQTGGYIDLPPLPQSENLEASNIDEYLIERRKEHAAKEYAVTIQRIVLGSTLATFDAGLDIQSIICGFENGLIEVQGIPSEAAMEEISALFNEINVRSCILDIRQYEDSSIIATVVVREDVKQRAADAITGKTIRNKPVTAKALKTTISYAALRHVLKISWEARTKSVSQDFYDILKQRLTCLSGIMFFEVSSGVTYSAKGNAIAWFTSATSAEQARKSLQGQKLSSNSIPISCSLESHKPLTHALVVPLEQYHLHEIGNNILKHDAISPTSEIEGLSTQAKNLGYDWFNGWQWFDDATTRSSLASELRRQVPCLTPVRWDCTTRTLTIYADSEANLGRASAVLETFANESKLTLFSERIDRSIEKSLLQSKRLEALERELGEGEVSFDVIRSQPVISYRGKSFLSIRQLMEDVESGLRGKDNGPNKTCPVCLSEVSAPVALVCGHEYCRPCLKRRILTSPDQNHLPIVCIGNGDTCKTPIAIPIIQSLLTPPQFQRLLDKITQIYFNKRTDEYHNCITPDCTQVYRCSKEAKYITCSSCNVSLCSACHSRAHSYLSCADWRVLGTPAEQERLISQWTPDDNRIKQCPKCKTRIEKEDGCNRVSCGVCGVHICWICLASFNDRAIAYTHLQTAHGGIYTTRVTEIVSNRDDLQLMQQLQVQEIAEAGMDAGASAKNCIVM